MAPYIYSTNINYPLPARSTNPTRSSIQAACSHSCSSNEHVRLDEQSSCLADLMGCTTHTQVLPAPSLILDLDCGTGVVSSQLGRDCPTAQVYDIDLSPVPKLHEKPPNVEYIKGDIHRLDTLNPRIPLGSVNLAFDRLLVCDITD